MDSECETLLEGINPGLTLIEVKLSLFAATDAATDVLNRFNPLTPGAWVGVTVIVSNNKHIKSFSNKKYLLSLILKKQHIYISIKFMNLMILELSTILWIQITLFR